MNILSKAKQIEIVAALCEGVGVRAAARLTGTNRKTVARVALQVGIGCAEWHDRVMTGVRVNRLAACRTGASICARRRQLCRKSWGKSRHQS